MTSIPVPNTTIIRQPEVSATFDSVEILSITDAASSRLVTALLSAGQRQASLVLWSGEAYDNVGQWTDTDAHARITELLSEANLAELFA